MSRTVPPAQPDTERRRARGTQAQRRGIDAERVACEALLADGWTILGQRLRTPAGEVDIVARRAGLLAFVEVKARRTLGEAAFALSPRQSRRLLLAAEILLVGHPDWSEVGMRFDLIVVDSTGRARRITDALRVEMLPS